LTHCGCFLPDLTGLAGRASAADLPRPISVGTRQLARKEVFFFEKKKQKTFALWRTWRISKVAAYAKQQKFFGSFFQKRTYFLAPVSGPSLQKLATLRRLAAYWDSWHHAFPALHKRGHWHIIHHLCTEAPAGAALGELLGLTRQALLVDDATVRDRVEELLAGGHCTTDPPGATLAARTILVVTPSARAAFDTTLLSLRPAPALTDRAGAVATLAILTAGWSALLDRLCAAQGISQARRLEARRHLLSTSHRTLLLLAGLHHYSPDATEDGILADRMAAALLERTGQNFQTTRDHIATLLALGVLERRAGRSLRIGLAAAAVPQLDAALDAIAEQLAARVRAADASPDAAYALRVRAPGEPPRIVAIDASPFTIGRTEGNALRLPAADISRTHCEIAAHGTDMLITDLGSTNGTEVNGHRIDGATRLSNGAIITLGPFELTFLAPEAAPEAADQTEATIRQPRDKNKGGNSPNLHAPNSRILP